MKSEMYEILGRNLRHIKEFEKILVRANDQYAVGNLTLAEYDFVVLSLKEAITETRAMLVELGKL
jgi:hypothetical protein